MITRVKGTQDILDLRLFNFVLKKIKQQLELYHFHEISTPILEPLALFIRTLGEETDVVSKEMYMIDSGDKEDKICLRPEATASTVRAFVENHIQTIPWQVYSWGPMFRHERPQKGRYRQFNQVTIEVIGASSISYDVQLMVMFDRLFHEIFKLNNYALLINFLGCLEDRVIYRKKLYTFLESKRAAEICATCLIRKEKNILRIFDCKSSICQKIYEDAPKIAEHMCASCAHEWQEVQDQLSLLSISFAYAPNLVRGLDYYNKTVFEFVSHNLGAQNAFCSGGRYDNLVQEIGGHENQPCVGAAIGIERLLLLLEPLQDKLPIPEQKPLYVVMPLSEAQHALALLLADTLRAAGLCVDVLFGAGSVKSMMRKVNKMRAGYALLIGETEQQNKTVMIKNMITGEQELIPQIDAVGYLRR